MAFSLLWSASRAFFFVVLFSQYVQANLPSYPIAVRNPFLSAWVPGDQSTNFPTAQAQFWAGQPLGWTILARVDNKTYSLFGRPQAVSNCLLATQSSISYTSTHTLVELQAGSVDFTIDFFSPVSPNNHVRQSVPFSYFTVTAGSSSGSAHNVEVMSGIDSRWLGETVDNPDFGFEDSETSAMVNMSIPNYSYFTVNSDMATWGHIVLAVEQSQTSATHQTGSGSAVYNGFAKTGKLAGKGAGDTAGVAKDFGKVQAKTSTTFAVGLYQEHSINYLGKIQTHYYRSKYSTSLQAMDFFFGDYSAANTESNNFDAEITQQSNQVSSNYAQITAAVVRQVFGALELTIPFDTLDTNNPYVFLKEISSDGNVNTIDVIYPMFPIMSVLAPTWIKLVLAPVADYLDTGSWPHPYTIHDLGATYPNATGHNDGQAENIILEATADFLIMIYDYQKLTSDTTFAQTHSKILQQYATYLASNGLYNSPQRDTVDSIPASANQTNLAIASAIGLNAYAAMTGQQTFSNTAQIFANKLTNGSFALNKNKTHFTYNYGNDSSWGTVFNLFPDQLLNLNTFPASIRTMQCKWYASTATSAGFPYASMWPESNGLWEMWIAATCPAAMQTQIVNDEYSFLTNGKSNVPFADRFEISGAQTGTWFGPISYARPTMGGVFAILAQRGVRIDV